jgi:hypothetical protein
MLACLFLKYYTANLPSVTSFIAKSEKTGVCGAVESAGKISEGRLRVAFLLISPVLTKITFCALKILAGLAQYRQLFVYFGTKGVKGKTFLQHRKGLSV